MMAWVKSISVSHINSQAPLTKLDYKLQTRLGDEIFIHLL